MDQGTHGRPDPHPLILAAWVLCWAWSPAYLEAFPDTTPVAGCITEDSPRSGLVTEWEGKIRIQDYWSSDAYWSTLTVDGILIVEPMVAVWYPLDTIQVQDDREIVDAVVAPKVSGTHLVERFGNFRNLLD